MRPSRKYSKYFKLAAGRCSGRFSESCVSFAGPRRRSSPAGRGRGSGITAEQCGLSGPRRDLPRCFQAVIKDPGKLAGRFVITQLPGPWLPLCHLEGLVLFFPQGFILYCNYYFITKSKLQGQDLISRCKQVKRSVAAAAALSHQQVAVIMI